MVIPKIVAGELWYYGSVYDDGLAQLQVLTVLDGRGGEEVECNDLLVNSGPDLQFG